MKSLTKPKKADIIIIAAILLASAVLYFTGDKKAAVTAEIYTDGRLLFTVDITKEAEPRIITLQNGIELETGKNYIAFLKSDCNGKHCISAGRLTKSGQCAACLPNKTLIKLTGGRDNDRPDAISS